MRFKIRSPTGTQHVLTLVDSGATISTLLEEICKASSLPAGTELDLKYGFPPRPLPLSAHPADTPLEQLPFKLQGEQLIVSVPGGGSSSTQVTVAPPTAVTTTQGSFTSGFTTGGSAALNRPQPPLQLSRGAPKFNKDDPPEVRLPGRGTVVLRVMEDDNSCLFRALSYVLTRSLYSVLELRQLVAQMIQDRPDTYSEAVLEQKRDAYCEWIKMESSWGGGIELGIFAEWFETEVGGGNEGSEEREVLTRDPPDRHYRCRDRKRDQVQRGKEAEGHCRLQRHPLRCLCALASRRAGQ
jgi:ubiquitin thioesterase OTU1